MRGNFTPRKKGNESPYFKGVGEISLDFYNHIRRAAAKPQRYREVKEFTVTLEYLWELYLKQNRQCALSKLPIGFNEREGSRGRRCSASLDRIDSSKGYVEGNVQWVHKHINIMKNKYELDYFVKLCNLVAQSHENQFTGHRHDAVHGSSTLVER